MNELTNVLASVPSHISNRQGGLGLNTAAHQNLTTGFAVISYRGSRWRIKYRGVLEMIELSPGNDRNGRPLPPAPVQELPVIVVGISPSMSKIYYEKMYEEGATEAPDCFSVDGEAPDPAAPKPQHTSCAVCPQNRFGSRTTQQGKKAKACQDSRRLAVVPAGDVENKDFGGPVMLRIPPMSLLNLDKYCRDLDRMQADISQVVTGLSFNTNASYPEIQFRAIGWVEDQADYEQAMEWGHSDEVQRMLHTATDGAAMDRGATEEAIPGPRPGHIPPKPPTPAAAPAPTAAAPASAPASAPAAPTTNGGGFGRRKAATTPAPAQVQPEPAPQNTGYETEMAGEVQAQGPAGPTTVQTVPSDMASAIDALLQR